MLRPWVLPLFLLLIASCSLAQRSGGRTPSQDIHWPSVEQQMPAPKQVKIFAGHGKRLQATVPPQIVDLPRKFVCDDKREVFHRVQGDRFVAFVSAKHKNFKNYRCHLEIVHQGERRTYSLFDLVVKDFAFAKEYLNVAKKYLNLDKPTLARYHREVAAQKQVYASGVKGPYFQEEFTRPLESMVTSPYGWRRIFNKQRESRHAGTDFRAAVGVPIPAANRGKVVFVGDLFFNGKTIIIDHGMNIFTMYCHLSKIESELGEIVDKQEVIGLAGMTGRASGPHLHWGLKVDQQWIDGLAFLQEGI